MPDEGLQHLPTFTCADDGELCRNLRLCLVTVRYVQQASESCSIKVELFIIQEFREALTVHSQLKLI